MKKLRSFNQFLNESKHHFNSNKYFICFDWDLGSINRLTVFDREFSSYDSADKNLSDYKTIISKRMHHNATKSEALNTINSVRIVSGTYLNNSDNEVRYYS